MKGLKGCRATIILPCQYQKHPETSPKEKLAGILQRMAHDHQVMCSLPRGHNDNDGTEHASTISCADLHRKGTW